jgi:uncharacterized membrane protein YidH (DUF202 family)
MSAPFRYLQRHPVLFTLGLLGTVLFCVAGLLVLPTLLLQLAAILTGHPHTIAHSLGAIIAEFFLLSWVAGYMNMWAVFTRLKRLDPTAYEVVTREMGFFAFCWSSRTAPILLHDSLGSLTLAEYPPSFRRWVNMTRTANRLLVIAVGLLVIGIIVAALVAWYFKRR